MNTKISTSVPSVKKAAIEAFEGIPGEKVNIALLGGAEAVKLGQEWARLEGKAKQGRSAFASLIYSQGIRYAHLVKDGPETRADALEAVKAICYSTMEEPMRLALAVPSKERSQQQKYIAQGAEKDALNWIGYLRNVLRELEKNGGAPGVRETPTMREWVLRDLMDMINKVNDSNIKVNLIKSDVSGILKQAHQQISALPKQVI